MTTSTRAKKRVLEIDGSNNVARPCKKTRTKSPSTETSSKLRQEKAANKVDKGSAGALANYFKSKNPFFVHLMKESGIAGGGWATVYIPKKVEACENWKHNDKVILQVGEESWFVFCRLDPKSSQRRISRGWKLFARDNSLGVGDACVFELIDRSRKLFKVVIFRAAKETNGEENVRLTGVTNEADRARMLQSVKAFEPEHPHFIVEVRKCYLYGGSMTVPRDFIHGYITEDSCDVILQLPDGRVWSVKCYINKLCAKFSAGWMKFSKENNLAAGDFCGFELIKERLLKVVIFRAKL